MNELPSNTRRSPEDFRDRFAFGLVKVLRVMADLFFARRYGHRAIVLETVASADR